MFPETGRSHRCVRFPPPPVLQHEKVVAISGGAERGACVHVRKVRRGHGRVVLT